MQQSATYIYQLKEWPNFRWDAAVTAPLLAELRVKQAWLLGCMSALRFALQAETNLQTVALDIVRSSEIEGQLLDAAQVRSSVARRLGLDFHISSLYHFTITIALAAQQ